MGFGPGWWQRKWKKGEDIREYLNNTEIGRTERWTIWRGGKNKNQWSVWQDDVEVAAVFCECECTVGSGVWKLRAQVRGQGLGYRCAVFGTENV